MNRRADVRLGIDQVKSLAAVRRDENGIAQFLQHAEAEVAHRLVVLDQQDRLAGCGGQRGLWHGWRIRLDIGCQTRQVVRTVVPSPGSL